MDNVHWLYHYIFLSSEFKMIIGISDAKLEKKLYLVFM
jgi:hypothetical protein